MKIYYLACYSDYKDTTQKRCTSPAGVTKMDYMIHMLSETGFDYEVYSTSQIISPRFSFGEKTEKIKYRASIASKNKYMFIIDRFVAIVSLVFFLLSVPRSDVIMVYHERYYQRWVSFIHRIKKWKLLYEIEELYCVVAGRSTHDIEQEKKYLYDSDAYIFPTVLLEKDINVTNRPSMIISGTYQSQPTLERLLINNCFKNNTVHAIYAGTFDEKKGGAATAISSGAFLPENYHIHILGFGSSAEVKTVQEQIKKVSDISQATITYDGCLTGEDYIRFVQSCHIGLSTQKHSAAFNATSFPSKVLTYLANGLSVVSVRIPAVEVSDVGPYLFYYDGDNPIDVAAAIIRAGTEKGVDSRKILNNLDTKTKKKFQLLIEELY